MFQRIQALLKSKKGFTLVELMAVIAIIGVLAAIAVPRFANSTLDAQAAKIAADLRTIDSAVAMHTAASPGEVPTLTNAAAGSTTAASNLVPNHLAAVPLPPVGTYTLGVNNVATWTDAGATPVVATSATTIATIRAALN